MDRKIVLFSIMGTMLLCETPVFGMASIVQLLRNCLKKKKIHPKKEDLSSSSTESVVKLQPLDKQEINDQFTAELDTEDKKEDCGHKPRFPHKHRRTKSHANQSWDQIIEDAGISTDKHNIETEKTKTDETPEEKNLRLRTEISKRNSSDKISDLLIMHFHQSIEKKPGKKPDSIPDLETTNLSAQNKPNPSSNNDTTPLLIPILRMTNKKNSGTINDTEESIQKKDSQQTKEIELTPRFLPMRKQKKSPKKKLERENRQMGIDLDFKTSKNSSKNKKLIKEQFKSSKEELVNLAKSNSKSPETTARRN